jgi:hypothetical protein
MSTLVRGRYFLLLALPTNIVQRIATKAIESIIRTHININIALFLLRYKKRRECVIPLLFSNH